MYIKMIQGIIMVFGLCLITVSPKRNFQHAPWPKTHMNIHQIMRMLMERSENGTIEQRASDDKPELVRSDECIPRWTRVKVPRESNDDINILLSPSAIGTKRCRNSNNMLECVPKTTVIRQFKVLRYRFSESETSESITQSEKPRRINIQEHTACESLCKITAKDCKFAQQFDDSKCQCGCRESHDCSFLQRWNSDTCRCVCKNPNRICPPGNAVNPETCMCSITIGGQTYATSDYEEQTMEIVEPVEDDDSLEKQEISDYEEQNSEILEPVEVNGSLEKEETKFTLRNSNGPTLAA